MVVVVAMGHNMLSRLYSRVQEESVSAEGCPNPQFKPVHNGPQVDFKQTSRESAWEGTLHQTSLI